MTRVVLRTAPSFVSRAAAVVAVFLAAFVAAAPALSRPPSALSEATEGAFAG